MSRTSGPSFLQAPCTWTARACYLCVPVNELATHVRQAAQSHLCLLYCQCTRKSANGDEKTMAVAAALTAGGTDTLIEGRHGVFVDNAGQDWDTALLRLVHNPISLREAMWAPYVRFGNMVADQLQKFVASKDDAISKASSNAVAALDKDIKTDGLRPLQRERRPRRTLISPRARASSPLSASPSACSARPSPTSPIP